MNEPFKILAVASTTVALLISFPGCGESSESKSAETHTADDGHDHAGDGDDHEGHDHAEGEHDEHDDHDHSEMRSLGSVTIAGTTLAVSVSSDLRPSSDVHLDLEVESGPIPAAVRFWIRDEAGTGELKSKAVAHDAHFHGQTESPANMAGASLWIEIEDIDGERTARPVSLER